MRRKWAVVMTGTVVVAIGILVAPSTGQKETQSVEGFADVKQALDQGKETEAKAPPSVRLVPDPSPRWTKGPTAGRTKKGQPSRKQQPSQAPSDSLSREALRYLGVRYRYAGTSPSRGFDCSGFVTYLLRFYGITAGRSAQDLMRLGTPVARSQLRPGDLIFFRNTGRRKGISHTGIYIGNGLFVHASSGVRRVVVTSLNSPYYSRRFAGARRLTVRKN